VVENEYAPSFETFPQARMITLKYDDKVDPPLREGIARMPVKDEPPTSVDHRFQFVYHLKFFLDDYTHAKLVG
jgi:hypothetical protein